MRIVGISIPVYRIQTVTILSIAHSLEKLYAEFEQADQLFLDSGMKVMDAHERLNCAAETAVLVEAIRSSYSRTAMALGKDAERIPLYRGS